MREFKIHSYPYDDDRKMFSKYKLVLEDNSISCLVGCNGSGKSTIIMYIRNQLKKNKAYELRGKYGDLRGFFSDIKYSNDIYFDFSRKTKIANTEDDAIFGNLRTAYLSTGEEICSRLGDGMALLGEEIRNKDNKGKNLFIFFDDCDAGTSIDMINDIKDVFKLIADDCNKNGITYYIIVTANSYEMCKDIDCISVNNLQHIKFDTYEQFKKFVLKTRKYKEKELNK